MRLVYPNLINCAQIDHIGTFDRNITQILLDLDLLWGETERSPTGGFCGNNDPECPTLTITTNCVDITRRRKRTTEQNMEALITIVNLA